MKGRGEGRAREKGGRKRNLLQSRKLLAFGSGKKSRQDVPLEVRKKNEDGKKKKKQQPHFDAYRSLGEGGGSPPAGKNHGRQRERKPQCGKKKEHKKGKTRTTSEK